MHTPQLVIYTDNAHASLDKLIGTPCSIAIQSFICGLTFTPTASGMEVVPLADYPLQQAINNKQIISNAKEGGKRKVLVALGGATLASDTWANCAQNVEAVAQCLADFVKQNNFDGIDIDWEDSSAFTSSNPKYDAATFLVELSKAQRKLLPAGQYLITHAPQPPYLSPNWPDQSTSKTKPAPYSDILKSAGDAIDYLNIQYYNNPGDVGDTGTEQAHKCAGVGPESPYPTSIVGLSQLQQLPLQKLILGKPTTIQNAGSGFLETSQLCSQVIAPLRQQFPMMGGAMGWQLAESPSSDALVLNWVQQVGQSLQLTS
ncbi:glycoside hydrolase family 18 protein [Polycladidibacter stylochi]|uniref:glycoside hydrolase family 18 protein n=1 Tax=Polycladidibacter stylochi TaxID=1807766 RepID=UPI0008309A7F|nr:glycoside hydrolase family 18 protein [Pseudovibrio stylochi]